MGTLISTILKVPALTQILGAVVDEGKNRLSKTKVGGVALVAIAPDWAELIPAAISGDATAIGRLVGVVVTWTLIWLGRGTKG